MQSALRAQALAAPQRTIVLRLLREYVDSRFEFYGASADRVRLEVVSARMERLRPLTDMMNRPVGTRMQ